MEETEFGNGAMRLLHTAAAAIVSVFGMSVPAFAAGTTAGTTISNQATATYTDPGGNPVTVPSNTVALRVDEVLNVTVATAEAGDVASQPGATNQVVRYTVTNTGNGSEAFRLAAVTAIGGDAFDPNATSLVIDSNGNGVTILASIRSTRPARTIRCLRPT